MPYAGAAWTGEPKGAAEALGYLLAPLAPPTPTLEPARVDPSPARAERITAPIAVGAQAARTDDTIPVPAFLSRKYNLGVLSLTSAWPEWTRQATSDIRRRYERAQAQQGGLSFPA